MSSKQEQGPKEQLGTNVAANEHLSGLLRKLGPDRSMDFIKAMSYANDLMSKEILLKAGSQGYVTKLDIPRNKVQVQERIGQLTDAGLLGIGWRKEGNQSHYQVHMLTDAGLILYNHMCEINLRKDAKRAGTSIIC